jgi:hypothetical protein
MSKLQNFRSEPLAFGQKKKKAESTAAGAPESNRVPLAQGVKLLTSSRLLAVVRGARALDVKVSTGDRTKTRRSE